MRNTLLALCAAVCLNVSAFSQENTARTLLVEAESFREKGGWVVDPQFTEQMGSPYLTAHGLGKPVRDAVTTVKFPQAGKYRLFVRTFNWTSPWSDGTGAGQFKVILDGKPADTIFGESGKKWQWQSGGEVEIKETEAVIALHDLTGFNGRCDALLFTQDAGFTPPDETKELNTLRRKMTEVIPKDAGTFDFVVVGGGMSGICAAVSAARQGVKTAIIQDRPVWGGNNSSEIRVGLQGMINLGQYPKLGNLVREFSPKPWDGIGENFNAAPSPDIYDDGQKASVVNAESNVSPFMGWRVFAAEKHGGKIVSVTAKNVTTGEELIFRAPIFADCTGDGTVGVLAGADWTMGREGRNKYGESLAPEKEDNLTMGASVLWNTKETEADSSFPLFRYGMIFNEANAQKVIRGEWMWECGLTYDQIDDFERIRDQGLMAVFSNWSFLKNESKDKEKYAKRELRWTAYIAGKRESRRLLGDVILKEQDLTESVVYPDGCIPATWPIDLHFPDPKNSKQFPGSEFMAVNISQPIKPYLVPYRCLYSRNVENLFMAGRNISVTHTALGAVRVMRTCGMMGEVAGMAASLCKKHNVMPRQIYAIHLDELQGLMKAGVPFSPNAIDPESKDAVPFVTETAKRYQLKWSDEFNGQKLNTAKWHRRTDSKMLSTQLAENVSVSDGLLHLLLKKQSGYEKEYTGGGVISKTEFQYGYYEVRMRVPSGAGWHTSFWTMRYNGRNTGIAEAAQELDICEQDSYAPSFYWSVVHNWGIRTPNGQKDFGGKKVQTEQNLSADFHIYSAEFTPEKVNFYFDGKLVNTVNAEQFPHGQQSIWLTSIAMLAGGKGVDDSRLPAEAVFDYVRFYETAE
ncbi:MAG: FAD-dependent oxidoreductase [Planctomycetaceae bacterium]|nr:FAD-dependent oxidoreductase [Planctomycetaceae bacterium]